METLGLWEAVHPPLLHHHPSHIPTSPTVGPICVPIEVQTDISILPLDNFVTFSAKTCFELLPQLTDEQLDFEIRFNNEVLGRNINAKQAETLS